MRVEPLASGYLIGAKINGDQLSLRYCGRICIDEQSRMRPERYGLALRSGNQGRGRDQVTLPTLRAIGSKIFICRRDGMNVDPVVNYSLAAGHCGDRCGATACFQPRLASIHLTHLGAQAVLRTILSFRGVSYAFSFTRRADR